MDRIIRNAPSLLLGAALAAAGAMTLVLTSEMTFFQDTWDFLITRRAVTVDTLLTPHGEHIVVLPAAIEQLFLRVFGMTTARPEYVLLAVSLIVAALLLFVYIRRRVGPWLALFATVLLLCLGPAWEVLLWPFEISFTGSVLFGIAMLLALDRNDRRGDVAACVFLALSFGFSELGAPFAAAAVVDVFQKRRSRGLGRAYVVAVPVALYAAWYLGWGREAEAHLSLRSVLSSPHFVFESMAAAVDSLSGLGISAIGTDTDPAWGRPMVVALIVAFAYRQVRKPGFVAAFWPVAAAAATNWFLTAFNVMPGRAPYASRYQYAGAVFVLLLLANLLHGVRIKRPALLVAAAVTVAAAASNLVFLKEGKDGLLQQSVFSKADLAAIEIARRTVEPDFVLTPEVAGTPSLVNIEAGQYLTAVDEYGSPAYRPSELAGAPDYARRQADIVLSQALPLATTTWLGAYDPTAAENCVVLAAGKTSPTSEVPVFPGVTRIELAPGPHASFGLRRFAAGEYPVPTEGAPGGSVTVLRIPRDSAPQPWFLHVEASQSARACR